MNKTADAVLKVTRDWAAEELEFARARVESLRVGGEAYNKAIEAVAGLARMVDNLAYAIGEKRYDDSFDAPEFPKAPEDPAEPEVQNIIDLGKTDPEPEPEEPVRTVDLAEVRTKAKAARDAGVKLADVWAAFDATKLSEVPHDKYGEVLDMLEEKLKELD